MTQTHGANALTFTADTHGCELYQPFHVVPLACFLSCCLPLELVFFFLFYFSFVLFCKLCTPFRLS